MDQAKGTYRFEFGNAKEVAGPDFDSADYYLEASGEFLTPKLQKTPDGKVPIFFSPYFRALQLMGEEGVADFKRRLLPFIPMTKERWPQVKRINDLWARGELAFLKTELRKFLPEDAYPLTNRLEMLKGVRHLTVGTLEPLLDWRRFTPRVAHIHKHVNRALDRQKEKTFELAKEFSEAGLLERYRSLFMRRIDSFVSVFPFLLPVFGKPYYKGGFSKVIYQDYGLSTTSFEDLKEFYADMYEDIVVMSRLAVAFNNLISRGDHRAMAPIRRDVVTLEQFDGLSKGSRLAFLDGKEAFDLLIQGTLNVGLRNAISHNSFNYDGKSQLLTYHPDGNKASLKKEEIVLLQFAELCRESLYALINLSELALWTERIEFMIEGESPDYSAFWAMVAS